MKPIEIHMFPCLRDNYGFLLHDAEAGVTATVDTPEVEAILGALEDKGWKLTHILNTHHHADHAGGNLAIKELTRCQIIGPCADGSGRGIRAHPRPEGRVLKGTFLFFR